MNKLFLLVCLLLFVLPSSHAEPADNGPDRYNLIWRVQSKGSHESMPCGGGDIGLNVWTENDEILFYISRSGSFDENNTLLKAGRVRLKLTPNPFENESFSQELMLSQGNVKIRGGGTTITVWVDLFHPVIHLEINSPQMIETEVRYESWRYRDRQLRKGESNQNSYKWAAPEGLITSADQIEPSENGICFFHRNPAETIFDVTVRQQGLDSIKQQLHNPLSLLTSGGKLRGDNLTYSHSGVDSYAETDFQYWSLRSRRPARSHHVQIALHTAQERSIHKWKEGLEETIRKADRPGAREATTAWWSNFWQRSYLQIDSGNPTSEAWKIGRNYQLFRYMQACNAFGSYPTKFNGGLFTFDPSFVDSTQAFTPDYRKWGGGTFTAQNQRLVYFPMLKSGDFEMMPAQFDFYLRLLGNAEIRSAAYWGHEGACFTEQMENYGLPNPSEYGWNRPESFDKGIEYNAWLEYQWDTVLEFCLMILETNAYNGDNIERYLPLIESCLTFFDRHYTLLAERRGREKLNGEGQLVLYPGTACETYKMAYNATPTVIALHCLLERLVSFYRLSEKREQWEEMLQRIPPHATRQIEGRVMIAPAELWERVNNVEAPQLYPVFPWRRYGVGRPNLELARNTYLYDPDMLRFRSHVGWKQDNIFAACLGLTEEAKRLTLLKMADGPFRFPAFWGPGFDWAPDHNWGGSGMIGLQEMLLQETDDTIYLFPSWPMEWDVSFRLHLSGGTVVEATLAGGELVGLNVTPSTQLKQIINSKPIQ